MNHLKNICSAEFALTALFPINFIKYSLVAMKYLIVSPTSGYDNVIDPSEFTVIGTFPWMLGSMVLI